MKDDGTIERLSPSDLDSIQKKLQEIVGDGEITCLAVLVPGSEARPHFAGPSYVRRGSQSIEASEENYEELIAQRASKVRRLYEWKGKTISLLRFHDTQRSQRTIRSRVLVDCNQFYVTLDDPDLRQKRMESVPLARISISFDHTHDRLQLEWE